MTQFFVCGQIDHFICNFTIFDNIVWRFNKPIWIYTRIWWQMVNQTNIRTFGCMNWTQTTIVCWVNVTDVDAGAVTVQSTRPQSGNTTLVFQFRQWIIRIHKLGQLGCTQEFRYQGHQWFYIDNILGLHVGDVWWWQRFANQAFDANHTGAEILFQQFTNRANTTIWQVVNVINCVFAIDNVC